MRREASHAGGVRTERAKVIHSEALALGAERGRH